MEYKTPELRNLGSLATLTLAIGSSIIGDPNMPIDPFDPII
jgi:hypothetical protein